MYAVHGENANPIIVGTYATSHASGPLLGVAGGKLLLNKQRVEHSHILGNKLHWSGVQFESFPSHGSVEFSPDGQKIVSSTVPHLVGASRIATPISILNLTFSLIL